MGKMAHAALAAAFATSIVGAAMYAVLSRLSSGGVAPG